MNRYLSALGRVLIVMIAVLGWLLVVPLVDLLSGRDDGFVADRRPFRSGDVVRAEAA